MDKINKYFPDLTIIQKQKFSQLGKLYELWNNKINVISRKDIEHLYVRHVLHSLAIAKIISFKPNTSILDVGTGGGFPGIPLAILFPKVQFFLIDSIAKKIKVVQEISNELNLQNVKAYQIRSNEIKDKFDFILGRAISKFPKFLSDVEHSIKQKSFNDLKNGIIYLKGGDFEAEIINYKTRIRVFNISDYFEDEFFKTKKIILFNI